MVLFPPLHVSCPLGFSSWGCPEGLGVFSPERARCGGGAAAWVTGVLAARGTQGDWQLGQQETECSRKAWQPVLANMLQYSCLENPLSDRESWQATVYRVAKNWTRPKWLCMHIYKTFLPVAVQPQWEVSVKVTQLLDLQGPSRCQVCREMDCLPNKSYDPAAAAKLLQSCPTLRNPIDGSPPGSPIPGILQARTLEWVAISFSSAWKWKVKGKSLGHVRLLATPWTEAYQAPPSMGFSRKEYWSGLPLPSPVMALSEPFFQPLVAGDQKSSLANLSP